MYFWYINNLFLFITCFFFLFPLLIQTNHSANCMRSWRKGFKSLIVFYLWGKKEEYREMTWDLMGLLKSSCSRKRKKSWRSSPLSRSSFRDCWRIRSESTAVQSTSPWCFARNRRSWSPDREEAPSANSENAFWTSGGGPGSVTVNFLLKQLKTL